MKFKDMKLRHKVGVGVVTGAAVLGMAGGAFAYFSATGAGNGSASVGQTGNNIAVVGSSATALTPGGASDTITFTAYNYSQFNQAITGIHVTGVQACKAAFAYAGTDSYAHASAAPTCSDTGTQATADATCAAGGVGTDATTWFTIPDVTVNAGSTGDGDLAPATGSGPSHVTLTETGTASMNDFAVSQDSCQGLHLNFTFTTS